MYNDNTMTDAKMCDLVNKIDKSITSSHTLLALYLLQEKKKHNNSFFYPYIALLPQSYSDIPLHWPQILLKQLNGTICEHMLKMKKHALKSEYQSLKTNLISFYEFQWARTVVITRIFSCNKIDCLVPIADLMNHALEPNVEWSFDNNLNGFHMLASKPMLTNSQLHDSYGVKCNSRWLTNYSFTLANNQLANQSSFFFPNPFHDVVCQRNFDDSFSGYNYCIQNNLESRVSQDCNFRFQVTAILDKISESNLDLIRKMFGFARCCCLKLLSKENEICFSNGTTLEMKDGYIYDINPMLQTKFISEENEMDAMQLIASSAKQTLEWISSSNDKNIQKMITGEKEVLQFYCDLLDFVKNNKFSMLRKSQYHYYWTHVLMK
jgi:hypothetical protein